jgi:indole-3-glycerol phosphate synthase
MTRSTYLDKILSFHRERCAEDGRPFSVLFDQASRTTEPRGFTDAFQLAPGLSVIAEIKRRSPSKGILRVDLVPEDMAKLYETSGASCLSVLTDTEFFSGSRDDLMEARSATGLPVLRKDFTVGARDICDARIMGADCVLLIVAALDDEELKDLLSLTKELKMDALVETHDEAEVERALNAGAEMIGVNQRDLVTFKVDQERALRVVREIPQSVIRVAESGIRSIDDAKALAGAGYIAILVGEAFVTSQDPSSLISAFQGI